MKTKTEPEWLSKIDLSKKCSYGVKGCSDEEHCEINDPDLR